jgi:hypothetical protein
MFNAPLAPYKAIQEEIVEFLTDRMEDPHFLNVLSVAFHCYALQRYGLIQGFNRL